VGEGNAGVGWWCYRRGDTRHYLERNPGAHTLERFFTAAAEDEGIATFETDHPPAAALALGVLLSALNPKNLLQIAAAVIAISQADLSTGESASAVGIFTLIAGCTVVTPTLAYLLAGARIQPALGDAKGWLSANDATVMAVLLLMIGVSLFGQGLGGLI
jgi:threonine/homoserine/homoserine lactone efflux protein